MSSQRSSRLQLPKKPKCVSAPAQALSREHKHIDESTKHNLRSPAASVGAHRHGKDAGAMIPPIGDSGERHLRSAENGAQAESRSNRKMAKGSPDSFAVHLDNSPTSVPEGSKRSRTASKKRQLLEDSEDDDNAKGKGDSDSGQSAAGESQGESGSEFSGDESESSEDANSDVADSEAEEESQSPKAKPKEVRPKAAAPKPKTGQKKGSAPAPPANGSPAAACKAQVAGPAARSGPAGRAEQPGSGSTSMKAAAAQKSAGAKPEVKQPLQPRAEVNTSATVTAAPSKEASRSKGNAAGAPAAAAGAGARSGGEETPLLKRVKPGASLAAILSGGPVYRVPGLRRAGGIKLHNVGPKRE